MAAPNRWAVREAAEATFFDTGTDKPRITLKTLKMTEVQTTGETVYARGGRGNAKLVGFTGDREATVTLQDAIFDNEAMAMLTGNAIEKGAKTIDLFEEFVVPKAGEGAGRITLSNTPVAISAVYPLDTDGVTNLLADEFTVTTTAATGKYEIAGSDITFIAADYDVDPSLRVRVYYTALTSADTKTVKVTADAFGGTFRLVCDVMVKDEATGQDFFAQFVAPRVKIEDDFSFNFSPEGDPSVLDIPLEILKDPMSEDMWQLIIYEMPE